jgi:hypothetical protein
MRKWEFSVAVIVVHHDFRWWINLCSISYPIVMIHYLFYYRNHFVTHMHISLVFAFLEDAPYLALWNYGVIGVFKSKKNSHSVTSTIFMPCNMKYLKNYSACPCFLTFLQKINNLSSRQVHLHSLVPVHLFALLINVCTRARPSYFPTRVYHMHACLFSMLLHRVESPRVV